MSSYREPEVLLVDWHGRRRLLLVDALLDPGVQVVHVDSPQQAAAYCPDVVIMPASWSCHGQTDTLGSSEGLAVLHALLMLSSRPEVIVFQEGDKAIDVADCCQYLLAGAHCYLDNHEVSVLKSHVWDCLNARRHRQCLERKIKDTSLGPLRIIWSSDAMQRVMERVHKAAMLSDVTVLLTGQTGTGKQLLAEAVHRLDEKRRGHPFITINCSTISPTLAESQLFGHRRGAFTDATADRVGCFRAADKGTLFLDEIGELDLSIQPKLLRALEERRVLALGQDKEVSVDIRVIAATNRELQTLVAEGRFRLDLYQRLSGVHIKVPTLSNRRADVLPLVNFFINKYKIFYPGEIDGIDAHVLEVLSNLDFEGNVRELENIVRCILFEKRGGRRIELADLPTSVLQQVAKRTRVLDAEVISDYLLQLVVNHNMSLNDVLNYCERLLIATALSYSHGSRSATASLLKLAQRTFFSKLRQHKL